MKFSEKEIVVGLILFIIVGALSLNLFLSNPTKAKFCGDSICSENEIGSCKLDCSWCGDGSCSANECNSGCSEDCSISQCENRICEPEKGENCINTPNDCKCIGGYCNTETAQCNYQSCGNSICDDGENIINCPNDCKEEYVIEDTSNLNYPIILVHGHSLSDDTSDNSINAFKEFQQKLENDGYAESKGIVLPKGINVVDGSWGKTNKPISVRTTYYLNAYDEFGATIGLEDNQQISKYAQRLGDVVEEVLDATGKDKVIIISHSMGGLVSRDYIKNHGGLTKVDKLVTIGTPNHGVYADIATNCENLFLGRTGNSPECNDMRADSAFLTNLNSGDETPGDIEYLTITGRAKKGPSIIYIFSVNVCDSSEEFHDEVVCASSVPLNGATNIEITGEEIVGTGAFHSNLRKPSKVPEVYDEIMKFIGN